MNLKTVQVRKLTEGAIMLALALVLNSIKLYKMPQGGSVTLGGYVPLFVYALRWGMGPGLILGALFGTIDLIFGGTIYYPLQAILDYPIAYMMLGLAGLGKNSDTDSGRLNFRLIVGIVLGSLGRALAAIFSGIIFFKEYLPEDKSLFWGSAIYNGLYIIPNTIISLLIIFLILKPISKMER